MVCKIPLNNFHYLFFLSFPTTHSCTRIPNTRIHTYIHTLSSLTDGNPLSSQYEKLIARRDILTTKLSNLQLKIWNNWQQTVEKRIAKGLDSKVMTLLTIMPHQEQQHQPKCMNYRRAEQYHVICGKNNETANNANNKVRNTCLGNNKKIIPPNKPEAVQCHTACMPLNDRTDSREGFTQNLLTNSNIELTLSGNESESLNKSSLQSVMKMLEINLSVELFALLRETKYLLAMQENHRMQKTVEMTVTTANDLTTQLSFKAAQQPEYQHHEAHILPSALLNLYAQRDTFWQRKIKLMKIAEYYNSIREGLNASNEMKLIQPVVDGIDERVECASKTLTWRLYGKLTPTHSLTHHTSLTHTSINVCW